MTVIGGLHAGECILYTAFGGPSAPLEPWDVAPSNVRGHEESARFWAEHALSAG